MRMSAASAGFATPRPPAAAAEMVTDLSAVAAPLLTAVTVTVPVLCIAPAGIVSVRPALSLKSPATAGDTGAADTVSVSASLDGLLSMAVTVLAPPFSPMAGGVSFKVAVGVASSSMMVPTACCFMALPASCAPAGLDSRTTTVSFGSSTASPVTATAMVLLVSPGAKVSVPPASAP